MTALPPRPTHDFNPLRFCASPAISEVERRERIAAAAYLKSAGRGFTPGHDREDWLAAESEIHRLLDQPYLTL